MNPQPVDIFISLGTNLGDRRQHLEEAVRRISALPHTQILAQSGVYTTAAWGKTDQPDFLNRVIQISSGLLPGELMQALLHLEEQMGRVRNDHWGPRTIDLDILFYGEEIHTSPSLHIPHPQLQNRNFVLVPLQELAPELLHPVLKKTISQLLAESPDKLTVHPASPVSNG